jgi:hypothetical protein
MYRLVRTPTDRKTNKGKVVGEEHQQRQKKIKKEILQLFKSCNISCKLPFLQLAHRAY